MAVLERDLLADAPVPRPEIVKCLMCGYSMMDRGNSFCSDRCRDSYDAGNPGAAQSRADIWQFPGWKVVAGPLELEPGTDYAKRCSSVAR